MKRRRRSVPASRLKAVRAQFEHWRRTRKKASPIPEALWDAAARLAAQSGTSAVAKALRLNHTDLKKRVDAVGSADVAEEIPRRAFVEVDWPASPAGMQWLVEMETPEGAKMKICLRGPGSLDLAALSEAFLRRRR